MRREIETLGEFDAHVHANGSLVGCVLQALDLRDRAGIVANLQVRDAVFLGCRLKHRSAIDLASRGACVFPRLPQVPFDSYRPALYTPRELYSDLDNGYQATTDARVYDWTLQVRSSFLDASLAQALHDHFVSDALLEVLPSPGTGVGILGGHNIRRGTCEYEQAAELGRGLANAGHLVMTGGGPGAMEAANLGAAFLGEPKALAQACQVLAQVPSFTQDPGAWARQGFEVKEQFDCTRLTVGIPTWFYGHEPPNVFPTLIAKYFDNAIREDILLRSSDAGLVYVPGRAGTTQEIFQALTRNYYAVQSQQVRPMVLLGSDYWTRDVPAWPLLTALACGRPMESSVYLVDTVDEVLEVLA